MTWRCCPFCIDGYAHLANPACPLCAGAAAVELGPLERVHGADTVARAIEMFVGKLSCYAPTHARAAAATRLAELGLVVPPAATPGTPPVPRSRQAIGHDAGRLLVELGVREPAAPKTPAERPHLYLLRPV